MRQTSASLQRTLLRLDPLTPSDGFNPFATTEPLTLYFLHLIPFGVATRRMLVARPARQRNKSLNIALSAERGCRHPHRGCVCICRQSGDENHRIRKRTHGNTALVESYFASLAPVTRDVSALAAVLVVDRRAARTASS